MQTTIDEVQQFIISNLRDSQRRGQVSANALSWANYDVYLGTAVKLYMTEHKMPTSDSPGTTYIHNYAERESIIQKEKTCYVLFSDALWDLCRKGILRPGVNHTANLTAPASTANEGFSITEFGKEWLLRYENADLLPADPSRFSTIFSKFQPMFGVSYFRRAKEAVSCFYSGNYLACCAMSGAATESILLSAGFAKDDKNKILKLYKATGGRRKLENYVFGQASQFVQERYQKYTDLISYWRDESGHGEESEIDVDEAYIAMLTLLRCAEFMRDHWEEITLRNI